MEEVAPRRSDEGLAPYVWMLCGCVAFTGMTQCASLLRKEGCDWRVVALARAGLVFAFAAGLALFSGAKFVLANPPVLWLRSIAGSLSLLCTFYALSAMSGSEVLTLTNTFPIWVAFLSWPLLRQAPTLSVWAGAGCGVAGAYLIFARHAGGDEGGGGAALIAVPLALVAALTSSVAMLGLNQLKEIHPWAIVTHFSGVATLFVLGAWLVAPPDLAALVNPLVPLLLLGVAASATLGQFCLTQAFTLGRPARVAVVGLTQIVMVFGVDLLVNHEAFTLTSLAGVGLVMLPTAWVMASRAAE